GPASRGEPARPSRARIAATALSYAIAAPAIAATVVALLAAGRLVVSNGEHLAIGGVAAIVLAFGFAVTTAAAVLPLPRARAAPPPGPLVPVTAASIAWPLAPLPVLAAAAAILATTLALFHDRYAPGGARITGLVAPVLFVLMGTAITITGVA